MSVTTSVGDLHKAPFQSCSVKMSEGGRQRERGEITQTKDTNADGVTDRSVGKMRGNEKD